MLVSAIITTYNRPKFLKDCLDSVVAQTYRPLEIIVVDDGTPGEANALLCAQYEGVQYVKIANSGGPARPRNTGAALAKGEFLAFLDDDDQWLPNKTANQVAILEQHPDFDLVHSPMQVMDEDGHLLDEICGVPGSEGYKHGWVWERMIGNFTLMMPTVLLRKSLFLKAGGFDTSIPPGFEDVEFWTRCAFFGKFYYQPAVTSHYRATTGSLSRNHPLVVHQPIFLFNGLQKMQSSGLLTSAQVRQASNNLIIDQIRRLHLGFWSAWSNLWRMHSLWWMRFRNLKSFALECYRICFTRHYAIDARR